MPSAALLRRARQVLAAPTDIQSLVSALGGDALIVGAYDCRYGVTLSGGNVSTLDDARGSVGYGPQLVAVGSPLPTIDASIGGAGITIDGTQNGLATATDAKWSLDSPLWMCYGGALISGWQFLIEDGSVTNYLGVDVITGMVKADWNLATQTTLESLTPGGATRRQVFVASQANGVMIEVAGRLRRMENRFNGANLAASSSSNRLCVGMRIDGSFFTPTVMRYLIVGRGNLTRQQRGILKAWDAQFHRATLDTGTVAVANVLNGSANAITASTASLGAVNVGDIVVAFVNTKAPGSATCSDNASVSGLTANTYTLIQQRTDGSTASLEMFYCVITTPSTGLVVTGGAATGGGPTTIVAWVLKNVTAYNADKATSANFGGSTAFTDGPTTPAPPSGSIMLTGIGTAASEASCPDPTGFNVTGENGFTSTKKTAAHQETASGTQQPVMTAHKITSTVESVAVTLPTSAVWFGVMGSFSPKTYTGSCVFDGDSIPAGNNLTQPTLECWPSIVMAQAGMSAYDWQNYAIGGWFLDQAPTVPNGILADSPWKIDPNGATDRAKDIYFLHCGTNDIAIQGATDTVVINRLIQALGDRRSAGYTTVLVPPLPRGDCTSGKLAYLKSVSDWCKASGASYADVVVPLYDNPNFNVWTFGASSAESSTYFQSDKIHPKAAGHLNIATDATYGVYAAIAGIR